MMSVVAEVTTAARDDHEISDAKLLQRFRIGERNANQIRSVLALGIVGRQRRTLARDARTGASASCDLSHHVAHARIVKLVVREIVTSPCVSTTKEFVNKRKCGAAWTELITDPVMTITARHAGT